MNSSEMIALKCLGSNSWRCEESVILNDVDLRVCMYVWEGGGYSTVHYDLYRTGVIGPL